MPAQETDASIKQREAEATALLLEYSTAATEVREKEKALIDAKSRLERIRDRFRSRCPLVYQDIQSYGGD